MRCGLVLEENGGDCRARGEGLERRGLPRAFTGKEHSVINVELHV